jgi:hypothetical protein
LANAGARGEWLLLSSARSEAGRLGLVVQPEDLAFPTAMKAILLAAFFMTAFLLAFLAFNVRQEPASAVRDRVKRFQITLLEEFLERKGEMDFRRWSRELESRRGEVRERIRASVSSSARKAAEVDELIDKGWDEILELLGSRAVQESAPVDLSQIEAMLRQVLESGRIAIRAAPALPEGAGPKAGTLLARHGPWQT